MSSPNRYFVTYSTSETTTAFSSSFILHNVINLNYIHTILKKYNYIKKVSEVNDKILIILNLNNIPRIRFHCLEAENYISE